VGRQATLYRERCPEVWLFQLDGSVEIWRVPEPNKSRKPGELFSSPLFPGLAIDPDWMKNYLEKIARIEQFNPEIVVAPSVINPKLIKEARALADRIAPHFGQASRSAQLESEISRKTGRQPRISQMPRARHEQDPAREQER
jgi:hypothetical protein